MKRGADPVMDWLLEKSDPGVRFFALRDLLGAPADDRDVLAARRATVRTSPVREILAAQQPEGWWVKPGAGYGPKYMGTAWSVIFLGQFGADGQDRRVRRGVDYALDHCRAPAPYGGFSLNGYPSAMVQCLEGNFGASMLELGYGDDPRLQQALDWLARSITGEGIAPSQGPEGRGWQPKTKRSPQGPAHYYRSGNSGPGFLCSANSHKPCAWGAIPALDALSRVEPKRRTAAMRKAIKEGVRFLLSTDPAAAEYPTPFGTPPSSSWFKFGYPMGYVQDVLRNLEVLTALGYGRDPRLKAGGDMVLAKCRPDGRWRSEYSYNGKTWCDLEGKREPSKWVSLRALRVLTRMGVTV